MPLLIKYVHKSIVFLKKKSATSFATVNSDVVPRYEKWQTLGTGVFRETPQGGGGFIFASLKLNQEKTPTIEIGFYRLWFK